MNEVIDKPGRKITMADIFGEPDENKVIGERLNKSETILIKGYRKQVEYGEKKFIKP